MTGHRKHRRLKSHQNLTRGRSPHSPPSATKPSSRTTQPFNSTSRDWSGSANQESGDTRGLPLNLSRPRTLNFPLRACAASSGVSRLENTRRLAVDRRTAVRQPPMESPTTSFPTLPPKVRAQGGGTKGYRKTVVLRQRGRPRLNCALHQTATTSADAIESSYSPPASTTQTVRYLAHPPSCLAR